MLYSQFELTDVVDCGSGARVEMSVMSVKAMFPFSKEGSETLLTVAEKRTESVF